MPNVVRNGMFSSEVSSHSHKLGTPSDLLGENMSDQFHNEIIITGRPGINIHAHMPATNSCYIIGLFLIQADPIPESYDLPKFMGKELLNKNEQLAEFMKHAPRMAKQLNVPTLFIKGSYSCAPEK